MHLPPRSRPFFRLPLASLSCLLAAHAWAAGAPASGVEDRILVPAGEGGYHAFRIPALVTRGRTAVVFLEGRRTSLSDFGWIDLVALRSPDGGLTWSTPRAMCSAGGAADKITFGNPCPLYDAETGRLWCLFNRENQQVFAAASDDDGGSWVTAREITSQVRPAQWTRYWTGPGHGLQLRSGPKRGRLIFPSYHLALESADGGETYQTQMRSHMIYSDDHGQTWKIGASTSLGAGLDLAKSHISGTWIPGEVICQGGECLVAELPDGRLLLESRNEAHDTLQKLYAWSGDGGETWTPLQRHPQLPDPGCQGSILTPPDGHGVAHEIWFAGISADRKAVGDTVHHRERLALRVSADGGANWREARVLHAGPAAYCDLAALPDGHFLCVYEGGEKGSNESIRLARFTAEWIKGGP